MYRIIIFIIFFDKSIDNGYRCTSASILSSLTETYIYQEWIRRAMWMKGKSVIQIKYPKMDWTHSNHNCIMPLKATSMIPV